MSTAAEGPVRLRFRFTKLGKVRFTGHRDVARMWERAVRRVGLALAYTEGFSPRPKFSFGLALPTGHESLGEYLDVELAASPSTREERELTELCRVLSSALPVGIDVVAAQRVEAGAPSLQQDVVRCTWEIRVPGAPADRMERAADELLAAERLELARERKGVSSVDDIRPAVLGLRVVVAADGPVLVADLAAQGRALRPAELIEAMLPEFDTFLARRIHQWIEREGALREPVPLAAPDALDALATLERVS